MSSIMCGAKDELHIILTLKGLTVIHGKTSTLKCYKDPVMLSKEYASAQWNHV